MLNLDLWILLVQIGFRIDPGVFPLLNIMLLSKVDSEFVIAGATIFGVFHAYLVVKL